MKEKINQIKKEVARHLETEEKMTMYIFDRLAPFHLQQVVADKEIEGEYTFKNLDTMRIEYMEEMMTRYKPHYEKSFMWKTEIEGQSYLYNFYQELLKGLSK